MANSTGPAREAAVANALDADEAIDFSDTADGWFKISPYGTFRGKVPGRPQSVAQANALAMVSEFNSVLGRLGRAFRGVPIYHGHPDVDPEIWPDDRRIGKITQLEARVDGLWGLAEWNSVGQENKAEGWWVFPSPRWDAPAGKAAFEPDRLISVGLTNTPRITESEPVFNSQLDNKSQIETKPMDPQIIRHKLGLAPEATDEEVLVKIETLTAAAKKEEAQETSPEKAQEAAEPGMEDQHAKHAEAMAEKDKKITKLHEELNNSLLDAALRDTRITPADRAQWATKLAGEDRESHANALNALKPRLNTASLSLQNTRVDRQTCDDLREGVANAVAALESTGMPYHEAWMKTKKDPKFASYFAKTEA